MCCSCNKASHVLWYHWWAIGFLWTMMIFDAYVLYVYLDKGVYVYHVVNSQTTLSYRHPCLFQWSAITWKVMSLSLPWEGLYYLCVKCLALVKLLQLIRMHVLHGYVTSAGCVTIMYISPEWCYYYKLTIVTRFTMDMSSWCIFEARYHIGNNMLPSGVKVDP